MAKSKDEKRNQAEARNYAWSLLSNEEKLAELDKRPGQCAKQRARIESANAQ